METAFLPCPIRTDWKVLYRAAICETDESVGSEKVAEAVRALLARERELFYADGPLKKRKLLRMLFTPYAH